ncbi:hypothetical protein [Clostridioides sp. ES-S-0010-02]|uniref:hypothetical protein n=1 Tax=Clostridioides sp. ES-S-0010-02 TaxID=2770776 RepID=UPI001D0FFB20|nr:hypothetical protein JJC01_04945 [Clostridioides sp. ES-S-0010-02]
MDGELRSLNFNGMGKCKGGIFDEVNIAGTGKIDGNIKCNKFDSSGSAKVIGTTECNEFFTAGLSKIEGNILASQVTIFGLLKCTGDINSSKVKSGGIINVGGNLKSDIISGEGCLKINKSVECESVDLSGILDCNGFLNCEELKISLHGTSNLNEVGACSVNIKKGHGDYCKSFYRAEKKSGDFEKASSNLRNLGLLSVKKYTESRLLANVIEADEISLENSEVKIVRGKNINIGKGCYIESLEYSENIDIDESSIVVEIKNVNGKVNLNNEKVNLNKDK